MMNMLLKLEPLSINKHEIIVDELDEITELIFVSKGTVVVGYEVNKQKKYCVRYDNYCVIGSYGITFDERSNQIYTALTPVSGYSIRKENWHELMNNHQDISSCIKRNILF